MSEEMKAREFWLQKDNKDIQTYEYFAHETQQYDDDIHVIEHSAYAELKKDAQELVEALKFYRNEQNIEGYLSESKGPKTFGRPQFNMDYWGKASQALAKWNEKYK